MSDELGNTVEVVIKNWGESIKPPPIRATTVKTYVLDAVTAGAIRWAQICDYEPNRFRLRIIVVDSPIALTPESPVSSPDPANAAGVAPQGAYLPPSPYGYDLFGPDAWYINSLATATATRVTVIKEYKAAQ